MATALKLCILSEEALEGETDMTNQATDTDPLVIAGRVFSSRLIIGTGKYKDYAENAAAAEASGAEIVTVAVSYTHLTLPTNREV